MLIPAVKTVKLQKPPFESQWREQQLAEAFTITLQQHPALQTLWLIVVQSLNKHVQNLHRDKGLCGCTVCGHQVRGHHPDVASAQYGATAHRLGPRVRATAHMLPYFLAASRIEPTNNRAERALRPAVIARKVSHCSKNDRGAYTFAAFTSVVRTLAKQSAEATATRLYHFQ